MHFRSDFEGVSLLPSFTSMRTNFSFSEYGVFVLCVKYWLRRLKFLVMLVIKGMMKVKCVCVSKDCLRLASLINLSSKYEVLSIS